MACLIKKRIYGRTYYYTGTPKRVNGKPKVVNLKYLGTLGSGKTVKADSSYR